MLGQKNMFLMKNRWKPEKVIFELMTEQGIVSHLDISNADMIYKFTSFATH